MAARALISTANRFVLMVLMAGTFAVANAAGPTGAQQKGAEDFLAAVATGSPEAVAQELHPDELEKLRTRLLTLLRAENSQGENIYRSRLFGPGRSLASLESATAQKFYSALAERLRLRARVYEKFDWLAAVPDGKVVYLVGKGIQPKDRGAVKVTVMVGLMQYGAQWRAIVPSEIEAQLDDLIEGRVQMQSPPPGTGGSGSARAGSGSAPAAQPLAPGISQLLARAEAALSDGNCEEYYSEFMSPNFNRATSRSAKKTLLTACNNNENTRETLITTLRIVQELQPRYDLNGTRAIYDVSGQGLPYERFVLEREGDRWYIAE
ncbi:MAG TPA: hypothetical protein VFL16_07305 [Steroidobacteraceae bacterium]|nr:hypothetical protein [Steroidobacteraceae bacterium]